MGLARLRTMAGPDADGQEVQPPGWRTGELFHDLRNDQFSCVIKCLGAEYVDFTRDDHVLQQNPGDSTIGVLVSGTGLDTQFRDDGSASLVDVIKPGDLFGEGWAGLGRDTTDRAVVAASTGRAILLDSSRLVEGYSVCAVRPIVVDNFLRGVLQKQIRLRQHFDLVTRRSLRERLSRFLLTAAEHSGHRQFTIPLTRAELAAFLHADRAAVSRELGRMRDESLISFYRNSFAVHDLRGPHTSPFGKVL